MTTTALCSTPSENADGPWCEADADADGICDDVDACAESSTLVACATGRGPVYACMVVRPLLEGSATAMATSLTRLVNVEFHAR